MSTRASTTSSGPGCSGPTASSPSASLTKSIVHPPLRRAPEPDRRRLQRRRAGNRPSPSRDGASSATTKIVLFLGRITMQKGPEYFIRRPPACWRSMDNVKFVVAGSGDMAVRMIEDSPPHGHRPQGPVHRLPPRRDVDRVFRMADCYVMPSVSEPFGIAAARGHAQRCARHRQSKQSGVSEVLTHASRSTSGTSTRWPTRSSPSSATRP
jgi:glycosyltransferase involved in cell wall biosynthesis